MVAQKTKTMQQRAMPNNFDAEQSILACILINDEVANDLIPEIVKDDFYSNINQIIFVAIQEIYSLNLPVDLVTVADRLEREGNLEKVGGVEYLTSLTVMLPSTASYKYYKEIVLRDSILRKLINASEKIIESSYESKDAQSTLSLAEKYIFDISKQRDKSSLLHIGSALSDVIEKIEIAYKDKSTLSGLKTGYGHLDAVTNGLQRSDLILVAARPAFGKTTFALNIAANVVSQAENNKDEISKKVCAIFSLEMPAQQLAQRLLCCISKTSLTDTKRGDLYEEDFKRLHKASIILNNSKIFIDDTSLITPTEILSKCRRLARENDGRLDLLIVDYLQLMNCAGKKDNRQQEVSEISRMMKIIAKELNVPVILISQLSRAIEMRKGDDRRPKLSDLRESGAIEQDADIVIFLHNPDEEEPLSNTTKKVDLVIAKHRNGEINDGIKFNFIKPFLRFEEIHTDTVTIAGKTETSEISKNIHEKALREKGNADIIVDNEINENEAKAFEMQYQQESQNVDINSAYDDYINQNK